MSTATLKYAFGRSIRITEIFGHSPPKLIDFDRSEWSAPGTTKKWLGTTRNWLKINDSETYSSVIYDESTLSLHELQVNDVVQIGFDQISSNIKSNKVEKQSICGIVREINNDDIVVDLYKTVKAAMRARKSIKPLTMIIEFGAEKSGKVLWSNFSSADPKKLIITQSSSDIKQSPEWHGEHCELTWLKINGSDAYASKSFEQRLDFDDVKKGDVVQIGKDLVAGYYRRLRIDRSEVIGVVKSVKKGVFTVLLYKTMNEAMKAANKEIP